MKTLAEKYETNEEETIKFYFEEDIKEHLGNAMKSIWFDEEINTIGVEDSTENWTPEEVYNLVVKIYDEVENTLKEEFGKELM